MSKSPAGNMENGVMPNRWWVYQKERFPIFKHGILIVVFSLSALCYSSLLRGDGALPSLLAMTVSFVSVFIFFLMLRIADEFKDFDEDSRYRSYRPVPRGLVTLPELATVAALGGLIQAGLCLWLDPKLLLPLAVAWTYLALMSKEFFVGAWLKAHPLLYMFSHMVIMPLIVFFAMACDWLVAGTPGIATDAAWFLAVSFFGGIVIELGRKIRAPEDEEKGVDTYSRLWGPGTAAAAWVAALGSSGIAACLAVREISFLTPVAAVSGLLFVWAALVSYRFALTQSHSLSKHIENISGIWILAMYLMLGVIPLLVRL